MSEMPPMSSLRLLHLEDDPRDHALVREVLQVQQFEGDIQHVKTKEAFQQALESGPFDVILSDLSLPDYNGMEALALAREKQPEIPFLFLSGTMGEQRAVDSLRNGATDYVLKEQLDQRLVPALRRALREARERADRRRAEEALHRSENQYRVIFDTVPLPMWVIDRTGLSLLAVNDAALRSLGYSRQEFLGSSVNDLFTPEELVRFLEKLLAADPTPRPFTVRRNRKREQASLNLPLSFHELIFADQQAVLVIVHQLP